MKVERRADHAVGDASCKSATGKTLAGWFESLDSHGGVALGRRLLSRWLRTRHGVDAWWRSTIVNEYEIARGAVAADGMPRGYSIEVTRTLQARVRDCFAAFRDAPALDAWFGARHDVDLRAGGHWRNADGNHATVRDVDALRRIRLLARDAGLTGPTPVEIRFAARGPGCRVTVRVHRLQTRAEADGYRHAWGAALDRLRACLERR